MKKLIILNIIILILLSSFVFADLNNGLIAYWNFEQDPATSDLIDQVGTNDSISDDVQGRVASGLAVGSWAWNFSRSSTDDVVLSSTLMDNTVAASVSCWVKWNGLDTNIAVFAMSDGTGNNGWIGHESSGVGWWGIYDGDSSKSVSNNTLDIKIGIWYQIGMTYTDSEMVGYFNGTRSGSLAPAGAMACDSSTSFGAYGAPIGAGWVNGSIDECYVWNRVLTKEEMTTLASNTTTGFYPFAEEGELASPTWTIPPDNTWTNNTNITMNLTHTANVSYAIYLDDEIFLYNFSQDGNYYFNFTTNLTDGTYVFKASVFNLTSGVWSDNVSRTWVLDSTTPTITIHPNNAFNSSGTSSINQYMDYLFINVSVADESDLFGFLLNVTRRGISYFNYSIETLSGNKTFNYTTNLTTRVKEWSAGVYDIEISVSDAHTANEIGDYDVKNGVNTIIFDTLEGNHIEISSDGSSYSTLYDKKKDRYTFGWNYMLIDDTRKFTIESNNKIYYLNSNYIGHFVVSNSNGANWIDFGGLGSNDYSVKKINNKKYEITFTNLPLSNQLISKSLGGVNKLTNNYRWYKGNYTTTYPLTTTYGNIETFILNISRNISYVSPNATLVYDNVEYSTTSTFNENYITFSRDIKTPQPTGTSQLINFSWNVNITQSDESIYNFVISNSINVSESLLDNCSVYNTTILRITGKDEETNKNLTMTLNILFTPKISGTGINNSYELSGKEYYTFCTTSDEDFTIDSIMEYGDGTTYTDRKYYLNDFTIDTSTVNEVFLYHLNNSKASEIVFTVFDTTTGDRVPEAFIKILRFYPGENVYRIVEIAKTDETGQSLGKMVLADVFYKFIIESPAGTVKLDTDVLRILSLTRSFGITFVEDYLDTWNKIHDVSYSTTCTKGTKTCRITWSDESNIVQDVTLEVWRMTGLRDELLFTQTTVASSGTISYTVTEDTATNRYVAKGFIESKTGTSRYPGGTASFFYSDNPFFTDSAHRIASLFPLLLLVIVIVFALVDFGVIGITIGALLGLILGSIIGILPLSPFYFISFIIMGVILIYKLSK